MHSRRAPRRLGSRSSLAKVVISVSRAHWAVPRMSPPQGVSGMHILWSPGRDEIGCGCNSIACAPRIGPIFTEFPGGAAPLAGAIAPGRGAKSVTTPAGGDEHRVRGRKEGSGSQWLGLEMSSIRWPGAPRRSRASRSS